MFVSTAKQMLSLENAERITFNAQSSLLLYSNDRK